MILPKLIKYSSEHYNFHFVKDSLAEIDINKIACIQEKCYKEISSFLNVFPTFKIDYFLLDTPESRSADKKCCATRIVEAGIKHVYVGMLDPNPKIYMKGVQYLLENQVTVTFFDEDITKRIKKENDQFIHSFGNNDTAIYVRLNKEILPRLSIEAIEYFCSKNEIDFENQSGLFWDFMIERLLIKIEKKEVYVDDFIYIAFGKDPSKYCDGAEITLTVRMSTHNLKNNTGKPYERKDSYNGPML